MLSRFSKLPGFSSFLSTNQDYPREIIDRAVTEIKTLGKSVSDDNEDMLQCIKKILSLMKRYSESIHVQRVSCHALSNLAMQVVIARWIVKEGGFLLIKKALTKFELDHKLCWLGSSAVWNLARPPANRGIIGKDGVKLMLRMLHLHNQREKVTNTCIGALSNLSLHSELKDVIAEAANVDLILSVLSNYANKMALSVMTSGAGLLANLAVSDDHASVLVERLCLPILLQLLTWKVADNSNNNNNNRNNNNNSNNNNNNSNSNNNRNNNNNNRANNNNNNSNSSNNNNHNSINDTLYRNTCAALNNMVTANSFLEAFLCSRGVEIITNFLQETDNELYSNLLENCLVNVEVDPSTRTTSIHLCALHGRLSIMQSLLQAFPFTDLDAVDSKNMSCLDYAISMGHYTLIEFLCKCGAVKYQKSLVEQFSQPTTTATSSSNYKMEVDNNKSEVDNKAIAVIDEGINKLEDVKKQNGTAIYETLPHFPLDLCNLIVDYNSNIDMLKGMNQFF